MTRSSGVVSILQPALSSSIYAGLVFVGAGRLSWGRGWIYASLFVGTAVLGSLIVRAANPAVLRARRKILRKNTKPFDKLFYLLFLPLILSLPLVAGFDAGRGHPPLSVVAVYPGVALLLLGAVLITWTLAVNAHAEATVRIQEEHSVITTGPYRYLRHPMYMGTMLSFPAAALITGSAWAFVPAGLMCLLFVWRTAREDAVLYAELPGYAEYASDTLYRLVPGVW